MNNTVAMLSEEHFPTSAESTVVALSPSSPPSLQDSTATTANPSEKPKANFYSLATKKVWKGMKCIIFMACATFFTYQTTEVYKDYYTYPTRTNIGVVKSKYFKMPAITFCNRNLVNRTYFCGQYPHLCSKPKNLKGFCQEHPYMCKGNGSNLEIPMVGYYTNSSKVTTTQIKKSLQELVRTTKETGFYSFSEYQDEGEWEEIYSQDFDGIISYSRCYSKYLRIFNNKNQTILRLSPYSSNVLYAEIRQKKEEYIFPWSSQVFLIVHSPFEAAKPMDNGNKLKSGFSYEINIKLEEEHLLPAPYATNCTDYETLWLQNNKTGPRSYQMCREFCWQKFTMEQYGCLYLPDMFAMWDNVCLEVHEEYNATTFRLYQQRISSLDDCRQSCKSDCLDIIQLYFLVRNPDVTVISHVPLYSDWELFSYIGGLIGCWLGISVWALVGIGEATLQKSAQYVKKLKRKRKQTAAASIDSKEHAF